MLDNGLLLDVVKMLIKLLKFNILFNNEER